MQQLVLKVKNLFNKVMIAPKSQFLLSLISLSTTLKGLFKREVYVVLQALTIVLFMVRIMVSFQGCSPYNLL
jgi:hypothetical protein